VITCPNQYGVFGDRYTACFKQPISVSKDEYSRTSPNFTLFQLTEPRPWAVGVMYLRTSRNKVLCKSALLASHGGKVQSRVCIDPATLTFRSAQCRSVMAYACINFMHLTDDPVR